MTLTTFLKVLMAMISSSVRVALVASLLALALAGNAKADTLVLKRTTVDGIQIMGVSGGKIQYKNTTTGVASERSLGEVKSISVDGLPALDKGIELADAKQDKEAIVKLNEALRGAKPLKKDWLLQYINHRLIESHKRMKNSVAASQVFCDLIKLKADNYFLSELPTTPPAETLFGLVQVESEINRKTIFNLATDVRKGLEKDSQSQLDQLLLATGLAPTIATPIDAAAADTNIIAPAGSLVLPVQVLSMVQENNATTPDIQLAIAGRLGEAQKAMKDALATKTEMTGVRLFVLGRVNQELAEKETDADKKALLQKEATLCFARVGAQFHEEESGYYYPAMLEFASISFAQGHSDLAKKIMTEIGEFANNTEETAYVERFNALKTQLDK